MEIVTDENEIRSIRQYMEIAAMEAEKSTCTKSKRGVLIVKNNTIVSTGHNKPTIEGLCNPCVRENIHDNSKYELCSAIHAEQMALISGLYPNFINARMYHIKVKNGEMRVSRKPSCSICSRMILESGISEIVLWQKEGYVVYNPTEFNLMSFENKTTENTIPSTQEIEIRFKKREDSDMFGFEVGEYMPFVSRKFIEDNFGFKDNISKEDRNKYPNPLTKEGMLHKMLDYMPFAWEKANDCRGLSAMRSISHFVAWTWLAGDVELSIQLEKDYEFYGKPHLIEICEHYGWDYKKWDDGERTNTAN